MTTIRMPALFVGHGSPMNAIEDNEFSQAWATLGQTLPRPQAILCVSAHWETRGAYVTAMEKPRTIHDFGGFPRALFEMQYPAPGAPALAQRIGEVVKLTHVQPDQSWGLDHGAWSVLGRMFPQADIPIVQVSLDRTQDAVFHYDLGQQLRPLRDEGVLIVGSGNIVHNLRTVVWTETAFDWAVEFDARVKQSILANDHAPLINFDLQDRATALSINSAEHYLPLLYVLGLQEESEPVSFFTEKVSFGSLSMRGVRIG